MDFSSYFKDVCYVHISPLLREELKFSAYLEGLEEIETFFIEREVLDSSERPSIIMAHSDEIASYLKDYRKRPITWFLNFGDPQKIKKNPNLFDLTYENDKEFSHILQMISHSSLNAEIQRLKITAYDNYEEVFGEAQLFQKSLINESLESVAPDCLDLLRKKRELESPDSLESLIISLNSIIRRHNLLESIELLPGFRLIEFYNDENILFTPLLETGENLEFVCFKLKNRDDKVLLFYISLILEELESYLKREHQHNFLKEKNMLWEESFSKIPFPLALISGEGELLLHNSGFSHLRILPKDCISFEDGQEIEAKIIYKVRKLDLGNNHFVFIFSSDGNQAADIEMRNISSEELGIISSSIAHELNNPLAGILAAVTMLGLEDDWNEEALISLQDMKNGASRCKELIEIFLGFSKASPQTESDFEVSHAFEKAMELLRFRMIESGIRLDIKLNQSRSKFGKNTNFSIMAMIFYLVLSEIMTEYSHYQLVAREDNAIDNIIYGSFIQKKKSIEIQLDESLDSIQRISRSKLIKHLVELEGLKLKLKPTSIIFMDKS